MPDILVRERLGRTAGSDSKRTSGHRSTSGMGGSGVLLDGIPFRAITVPAKQFNVADGIAAAF
jgi:hypothetical protein